MSAPETNIDKQVRRHRGPLYGMVFVAVLAAVLCGALIMWTPGNEDTPSTDVPVAQPDSDN